MADFTEEQMDSALRRASEALSFSSCYETCVRPIPSNSAGGCESGAQTLIQVVLRTLEILGTPRVTPIIEEALSNCSDLARSEVLLRHEGQFERLSPNAEECRQMTQHNGRKMSWAQRLGEEMHEVAKACVDKELGAKRKGGYSLEPRYRITNPETGEMKLVSAEKEDALVKSGNAREFAGTVKPDVVIHEGDPLNAQAVYDFKFPCVNIGRAPDWSRYPEGHPFESETQKTVYQKYIASWVARIIPWLGVVP